MTAGLWTVVLFTFAVNVPCGYWRAGAGKFSVAWFVAVHAAVPLIVVLRLVLGVPFRIAALPLLVAAYFAGQLVGARLRAARAGTVSGTGRRNP